MSRLSSQPARSLQFPNQITVYILNDVTKFSLIKGNGTKAAVSGIEDLHVQKPHFDPRNVSFEIFP
jgi:hypothetical protein